MENLIKSKIREIPDWPKKGVSFKDITPLLVEPEAFQQVIDWLVQPYLNQKIDKIIGIDARGFIFASALAYKLKTGLSIVRKKGKLPWQTVSQTYDLEYASNIIEMHKDAVQPGEKVLLVDDVLATGGTMKACVNLVKQLGGEIISIDFLIELDYLKGREQIKDYNIRSLIHYE